MLNRERLNDILKVYKEDFVLNHWKDEMYKWEAIKHFQDNWDINASDFPEMLKCSLAKTYNLLASMNHFPAKMITIFAEKDPEKVRSMYIDLFDESKDVYERMETFKNAADSFVEDPSHQSYQYENAISVYLWLRYPDKYYIYKYGEVSVAAKELESNYAFKKGAYADNVRNSISFKNELCEYIKQDEELTKLFKSQLTDTCYPDPDYRTLTDDVGFYISRNYQKIKAERQNEWFPDPNDYTPNITVDQWIELLNNDQIFTDNSLQIMKRLKDYGGAATCTQLAIKYGETKNFYNNGSSSLAKRVNKITGCPVLEKDNENAKWWPILYVGRYAAKDEEGGYVWKLRDELSEALDHVDLSKVDLYAFSQDENETGYWWLNANPKIWSFSDIAVGEVKSYTLYNDNGNKRRIFQNFLDAKAGDMIIGYESYPVKQIVALCKVSAEQDGEKFYFEKVESLVSPIDYLTLHECPELEKMEYFQNPQGSLFKLTKGEYDFIIDLIRDENPAKQDEEAEKYTKEDFLSEVYMDEAKYDTVVSVLKNKKNIILQGAPGVGKTFAAKRLAYSMIGKKEDSQIEFVQFHQNYSYEDFVMGYKPIEDKFELRSGTFYRFCKNADNHPDKDFFFIIDEINRGNLSKIFGELLMLIEKEYRGTKVTLAYNGLPFSVPENIYIIGMMNTADRSLALIDYALRRRFAFIEMTPGFDSEGFVEYQKKFSNETFDELIEKIKELNLEIERDKSLGKGFCIGHSYFCNCKDCNEEWMNEIVEFDIIPTLNEYWFDELTKVQKWANIFHSVIND